MKRGIGLGLCLVGLTGGAAGAQAPPDDAPVRSRHHMEWRGPYFLLGLGVEGYTGKLAPNLDPGPTYGVLLGYRPNDYLGLEVGYSGGASSLAVSESPSIGNPDIVRNGAQAGVTLGFSATRLQPFALAGIGVERYSVRSGNFFQFFDDTGGYAPVGLGARYQLTPRLTVEARGTYSFLFGQDFARAQDLGAGDGRYAGTLQIGGSY
ncbi:outer membrane beta-barrel protein [Corallococcus sp. bb12-1]|uniref:outer membrane beta-barrel protein n=1 Tax=Corallococcus sp. bb12-1 TaxID=2996784 RepID=UPI002270D059|nr:outer membrane beta-barrel protein [Corallococcus sp. bb12-1]MCY1043004.1 outer membrane beta-barrel protein [Corallococcus sp. bb12-1]